ncbi:hypothetical protein ACFYWP_05985 [Actinacidiphila glaucinigra]|uniref:hypothetical protein n=1 Tax=Actinacidiphila glaucinigra TaxID=235986 RepID=UPI0036AA8CA7
MDGKSDRRAGNGRDSAGASTAEAQQALTGARLRAALITSADVPGYVVAGGAGAPGAPGPEASLTADRPACRPLSDPVSSRPARPRGALVTAAVTTRGALGGDGELNLLLLSAHRNGEAAEVVGGITAALEECRSFGATDGEGGTRHFAVRPAKAPAAGDEAAAYVMTDTGDTARGTATVTVVRTGSSTATYVTVKPSGDPGGPPLAVVRAQHAKLAEAAVHQ